MLFTSIINQKNKKKLPTNLLTVKSLSRITVNQHIFKDGPIHKSSSHFPGCTINITLHTILSTNFIYTDGSPECLRTILSTCFIYTDGRPVYLPRSQPPIYRRYSEAFPCCIEAPLASPSSTRN